MMLHFYATYRLNGKTWTPSVVRRDPEDHMRSFERPDYTYNECEHTAVWLNERNAGYPVPAKLTNLRSARNDKASKPINTGRLRANLARKPRKN